MIRAALVALVGLPALEGCSFLTRFSQESYICAGTDAPFERLAFSRVAVGQPVTVEGMAGGAPLKITAVTKAEIELENGEELIRIDRESGQILVIAGARVKRHACKKAAFRM